MGNSPQKAASNPKPKPEITINKTHVNHNNVQYLPNPNNTGAQNIKADEILSNKLPQINQQEMKKQAQLISYDEQLRIAMAVSMMDSNENPNNNQNNKPIHYSHPNTTDINHRNIQYSSNHQNNRNLRHKSNITSINRIPNTYNHSSNVNKRPLQNIEAQNIRKAKILSARLATKEEEDRRIQQQQQIIAEQNQNAEDEHLRIAVAMSMIEQSNKTNINNNQDNNSDQDSSSSSNDDNESWDAGSYDNKRSGYAQRGRGRANRYNASYRPSNRGTHRSGQRGGYITGYRGRGNNMYNTYNSSDRGRYKRGYSTERRSGDWDCPQCNFPNFASRWKCRECATPRPNHKGNNKEYGYKRGGYNRYRGRGSNRYIRGSYGGYDGHNRRYNDGDRYSNVNNNGNKWNEDVTNQCNDRNDVGKDVGKKEEDVAFKCNKCNKAILDTDWTNSNVKQIHGEKLEHNVCTVGVKERLNDQSNIQNERKMEKRNVSMNVNNESVQQFKKFLINIGFEEYFESFINNGCDMSYIRDFDDETLMNDIGINSKLKRKKFLRETERFKNEMDEFIQIMSENNISSTTCKQLNKYGIVTMDVLCNEVKQKMHLKNVYQINNDLQCDILWNVIQSQLNPKVNIHSNDDNEEYQNEGIQNQNNDYILSYTPYI